MKVLQGIAAIFGFAALVAGVVGLIVGFMCLVAWAIQLVLNGLILPELMLPAVSFKFAFGIVLLRVLLSSSVSHTSKEKK